AYDCVASYGGYHNVYIRGNAVAEDCLADEAYFGSSPDATMFVFFEDSADGFTATFRRCTAQLSTYDANVWGFYGHRGSAGSWARVTLEDCVVTNAERGITLDRQITDVQIDGFTCTGVTNGVYNAALDVTIN